MSQRQQFCGFPAWCAASHEQDWLLDIRPLQQRIPCRFCRHHPEHISWAFPAWPARALQRRKAFFSNKRTQALKTRWAEQEDEASLDKKMIAGDRWAKTAKTEDICSTWLPSTLINKQKTTANWKTRRRCWNATVWNRYCGEMLNHEMGYQQRSHRWKTCSWKLFCTDLLPGRPTAARPRLGKCPADAIRQSIRPGIYGDLACRSSL